MDEAVESIGKTEEVVKLETRLESITIKIGDNYITATYDDFVEAGLDSRWAITRIANDDDILKVLLNKALIGKN